MDKLTPSLVTKVEGFLHGKRLEKFRASVQVLNDSLALGGWVKRGSVKSSAGFYQGLLEIPYHHFEDKVLFDLSMCFSYGGPFSEEVTDERIFTVMRVSTRGAPDAVARAWVALCNERAAAVKALNAARPVPKITAIGLSPKVTMTLTECNLDLDLASIEMAKLEPKEITMQARDKKGTLKFDADNKPVMVTMTMYFVVWTPGILHNQSRFASGCACHACGKYIPSGMFVPIEANCKRLGKRVSMWLGCDCARNIFGIKDVGIDKALNMKTEA